MVAPTWSGADSSFAKKKAPNEKGGLAARLFAAALLR